MSTTAASAKARLALTLVRDLQEHLRAGLAPLAGAGEFRPVTWQRDGGRHGGGVRLGYAGGSAFNRASINVSQVHYDDEPERPLGSATALSSIVHPAHPLAPSLHVHVSWTEMKGGDGYWRVMADLNPSIPDDADTARFKAAMAHAAGGQWEYGAAQGDRYFHIPALQRHRGVAHFYLEQFKTGDEAADRRLAEEFGRGVISCYASILADKWPRLSAPTAEQRQRQLAYHTVYLFQVLTLDRGTTSGLLVHDQNDVGILGSLPARVDVELLRSWQASVPQPQDELVGAIVAALPADGAVEDEQKLALCEAVRSHYRKHPEALSLQAKGDVVPPTVGNHRG
jgi:coproporphyrinogen III oxidase